MVSSFSAHETNQQPALSNDFLIVCLITEWTQPDYDKQSMDQTGITQMSSLHLNPVISGEGKGREGYPAQERHSFILPRWVCAPRTGYLDIETRWRQNVLLFSYPYFDIYFGFENFLPPVFTVWHDALDCKKMLLTRHSHGWKK